MEKLLTTILSGLVQRGTLTVISASGREYTFGDGTGEEVIVRFLDRGAERALVFNPELRLGEIFTDGRLVVERGNIYDFLSLLLRDSQTEQRSLPARFLGKLRFLTRRTVSRNNPWRARRNVAHHYDLDYRLYELFLDPDRQYSCAYFERPDCTLEEAQIAKKRLVTAKLLVEPDSRVLDIGCGWGGLGLYIKQIGGARQVQGITLSTEQLQVARERAEKAGVADTVRFMLQDYREVEGSFDRIVSVGMFEHVGPRFYGTYFNKCRQLLKPDGVMLMHTIGHMDGPWYPNPWIDKYIFPGGQLPALSEIIPAIERAGLIVTDVECLRMHYAETLLNWRRRFMAQRDKAMALYDERFCRMWEFYLACCEAAFRYQNVAVFQVQCARSAYAVPLTRSYIAERFEDLRMREKEIQAAAPEPASSDPVPLRKQRQ
ncbi:MAG: cyclopropane-fatty-acyl-phospholipid synthase family protein [Hyphomicrobium sp.]|jgi:cyclopropane-fatty-acyl-phospholipid synthase